MGWQKGRPRTNKYGNIKMEIDGHVFDSKKEAKRYCDLKLLQKAHVIYDLQLQVPFELQPGFRDSKNKWHKPIVYIADFVYWQDGNRIIEDVKSEATQQNDVYRLKRKMMAYKGNEITEV